MAKAKYSIGIDLGTTNSALSYVDIEGASAESQSVLVPQLDNAQSLIEAKSLPSFLYLPNQHEKEGLEKSGLGVIDGWALGEFARKQTSVDPGRVAHSAKSWLGHHLESPERKLLPWDSDMVTADERISPLEASTLLLTYFKRLWDSCFKHDSFADQLITVTVPASFDVAAQQATTEAAIRAGYPDTLRLLEEPQAAFYRWMEAGSEIGDGEDVDYDGGEVASVLVVDIGGGTSDFSFFRLKEKDWDGEVLFERVAASDHILLGGDNIDLALAHAIESLLDKPDDEELSGDQWRHLVSRSRALKEECLSASSEGGGEQTGFLRVSIPAKGSGLLAGSLSAEIDVGMVREMLIDSFFPDCQKSARPDAPQRGLVEWGLPYAADFAVTRYLADFLRGLGSVDAVLFNGGTLSSPALQGRLLKQLERWQEGKRPRVLRNVETDLAVARGAAFYGSLRVREKQRIESGARRAVYIELETSGEGESSHVACVLPKGSNAGDRFSLEVDNLKLRVNDLVRFQTYQGSKDRDDKAGAVVALDEEAFSRLPVLETKANSSGKGSEPVDVRLECSINELGLLEVRCVNTDSEEKWDLNFSLRGVTESAVGKVKPRDEGVVVVTDPGVPEKRIQVAESNLRGLLKSKGKERQSASRLLKVLERELDLPKHEWNLLLSRRLADVLLKEIDVREVSAEKSEVWAYLTGYLMRPGFGDASDELRMSQVWDRLCAGVDGVSKGVETQELVLWRRLAGGLSQQWQEILFERQFPFLDTKKGATAERVRLLGSLEKLTEIRKGKLVGKLLRLATDAYENNGYVASYIAALSGLLSRSLFKAGPEFVVSAAWVENAWDLFGKWDWEDDRLRDMKVLFLRAARVVKERRLNLPSAVNKRIYKKLKKAGVPETKLQPLVSFVALTRAEQVSAYGEALPAGLVVEKAAEIQKA